MTNQMGNPSGAQNRKKDPHGSRLVCPDLTAVWRSNPQLVGAGTIRWEDVVDSETGKATGEMTSHVSLALHSRSLPSSSCFAVKVLLV